MLTGKQKETYAEFYDAARHNDVLDPKTTLMIHLASSMAFACYP